MTAPIVFFDIAGPAEAKLGDFYRDVFGWAPAMGPNLAIPIAGPPLMGTLRQDPPGKTLYIGVKDVTATLARIVEHGGRSMRRDSKCQASSFSVSSSTLQAISWVSSK